MITFAQHLEISKHSVKKEGMSNYISKLPPEEMINVARGITETYPLNINGKITDSIRETFNVYDNVMDLVLGQFIMLEQIITGKTNFKTDAENDLAIAELILRPKDNDVFDNEDKDKEKENRNKILSTPVQDVYNVLTTFIRDRDFILFKQFSGVFYDVSEDDEENEDEDEITSEKLFSQQWYWYSMVRMLAKEDITRYSEIYMLKMSIVMPEMSFIAQRSKIESAAQRQQEAMRKL